MFSLLAFTFLIYSCGSDDACDGIECLNNGVCLDGTCDCPVGFTGDDCGVVCKDNILGTWAVTNIAPAFCDLLSYEFGTSTAHEFITIAMDDGTTIYTGQGLLEDDCSEMTYTVSGSGNIYSGSIRFNGDTFEDASDLGCLFTAEKQ